MARDTDRKVVSEALRLSNGAFNAAWGTDYADRPQLTLTDFATNELNVTYNAAGRIVHVAHWQVLEGTNGCAHREPISQRKREYVLRVIEGV